MNEQTRELLINRLNCALKQFKRIGDDLSTQIWMGKKFNHSYLAIAELEAIQKRISAEGEELELVITALKNDAYESLIFNPQKQTNSDAVAEGKPFSFAMICDDNGKVHSYTDSNGKSYTSDKKHS